MTINEIVSTIIIINLIKNKVSVCVCVCECVRVSVKQKQTDRS